MHVLLLDQVENIRRRPSSNQRQFFDTFIVYDAIRDIIIVVLLLERKNKNYLQVRSSKISIFMLLFIRRHNV